MTREHFNSENKYRCEVCTGLTEAIRSVSYPVLPRLLIIQLKRFSGGMEKINSYIPTPFVMECFCSQCHKNEAKKHVYKLYSVITHVGATMSVGHYIAYTSSLDSLSSDYIDCPKDKRKVAAAAAAASANQQLNGHHHSTAAAAAAAAAIPPTGSSDKNSGIIKKMIFGRTKASSSGDVTKNMKNLNGSNGGGSLRHSNMNGGGVGLERSSSSAASGAAASVSAAAAAAAAAAASGTTLSCQALNCCGILMKSTSTPSVNEAAEPIWYMCDDDKIKALSQCDFQEMLMPGPNKSMITPYLLFYARSDLVVVTPSK